MKVRRSIIITLLGIIAVWGLLVIVTAPAYAENKVKPYGWQLMSEKELVEHEQELKGLKTEEERNAFRNKHREKILERARSKGVIFVEAPSMSIGGANNLDKGNPDKGKKPGKSSP